MKRHFLFCVILILLLVLTACVVRLNSRREEAAGSAGTSAASPSPSPSPSLSPSPGASPAAPAETRAPAPEQTPEPTPEQTPEPVPETTPEPEEPAQPTEEPSPEPAVTAPTARPNPGGYAQIDLSSPAILPETGDMGQEYLDQIIFLGDSTTYGMKYYGVLSGGKDTKQVWTPESGTLTLSYQGFATIVYPDDGSELTIREAVEKKKPAMMVITLGVNGVSFMGREDFISEYTDLVTDIMDLSPDTKVIIQSIFPVASHYEYLGSINNEKICLANTWLLEVAENTGARYLDTISVLMGDDGWLPDAYQNGDGLHLNTESFNLVLNYIRTHGWT